MAGDNKLNSWGRAKREAIRYHGEQATKALHTKSPFERALAKLKQAGTYKNLSRWNRAVLSGNAFRSKIRRHVDALGYSGGEAAARLAPDSWAGVAFDVGTLVVGALAGAAMKLGGLARTAGTSKALLTKPAKGIKGLRHEIETAQAVVKDIKLRKKIHSISKVLNQDNPAQRKAMASVHRAKSAVEAAWAAKTAAHAVHATKLGAEATHPLRAGSAQHGMQLKIPQTPASKPLPQSRLPQSRMPTPPRPRPTPGPVGTPPWEPLPQSRLPQSRMPTPPRSRPMPASSAIPPWQSLPQSR